MKKIVSMLLAMVMLIAAVPAMASENYYTVSELVFTDFDGDVIENPGTSCIVRAMVTKNKARTDVDSVVMVAYSTDGKLISFNVLKGTMVTGADSEFSALVNIPDGKELGYVKVTVWDSISNMNALSNVSRIDVNETAEPESGSVMPDTVNVYACVVENFITSGGGIPENQVRLMIDSLEYDYSDCKTPEEVYEKEAFYNFVYETYGLLPTYYDPVTGAMASPIVNINSECGNILPSVLGKAKLKIDKNPYGMHELVEFTYLEANKIVTYDNNLFDDNDYRFIENAPDSYFRYYPSADSVKSEKCNLGYYFNLYVNGVQMSTMQRNIDMYVINNHAGNITFVDVALADGDYDNVFVDYYETAIVDSIDTKYNKIMLKNRDEIITIDDDAVANIYLNGEKISLSDLKEDDVLSIKCDPWDIEYSIFYDIYVSRNVKTGICNAVDYEKETVTIGNDTYKSKLFPQIGNEYKIYLDVFGKIIAFEEITSPSKGNVLVVVKEFPTPEIEEDDDVYTFDDLYDVNEEEIKIIP